MTHKIHPLAAALGEGLATIIKQQAITNGHKKHVNKIIAPAVIDPVTHVTEIMSRILRSAQVADEALLEWYMDEDNTDYWECPCPTCNS